MSRPERKFDYRGYRCMMYYDDPEAAGSPPIVFGLSLGLSNSTPSKTPHACSGKCRTCHRRSFFEEHTASNEPGKGFNSVESKLKKAIDAHLRKKH